MTSTDVPRPVVGNVASRLTSDGTAVASPMYDATTGA